MNGFLLFELSGAHRRPSQIPKICGAAARDHAASLLRPHHVTSLSLLLLKLRRRVGDGGDDN